MYINCEVLLQLLQFRVLADIYMVTCAIAMCVYACVCAYVYVRVYVRACVCQSVCVPQTHAT